MGLTLVKHIFKYIMQYQIDVTLCANVVVFNMVLNTSEKMCLLLSSFTNIVKN